MENIDMPILDQSAEYYRLREGHERALALAAKTNEQRSEHLTTAERYATLAGRSNEPELSTGGRHVNPMATRQHQSSPDERSGPNPVAQATRNLPNVRSA